MLLDASTCLRAVTTAVVHSRGSTVVQPLPRSPCAITSAPSVAVGVVASLTSIFGSPSTIALYDCRQLTDTTSSPLCHRDVCCQSCANAL